MTDLQHVSPDAVGVSAARLRRVDTAMQRYIDEGKLAGLVTMLVRRGKIFHAGCYGMADRERQRPMQTNTIFRMASVSKAITTAAVLTLYEEGHFVLDQDIANFLPAFAATKVYAGMEGDQPKLIDKQRPITVRQCLLHTAGFASGIGFGRNETLPEIEMKNLFASISPEHPMNLAAVVDTMARIPLADQPNTKWVYGPCFEIAARLVEVISGKSFNDFLRERLFEPLGMADSGFIVSQQQLDRFCAFYGQGDKPGEVKLLETPEQSWNYIASGKLPEGFFTSASGGMVSTPDDVLRFSQMLLNRGQLNGVRVLAPRTVDLLAANHLPPPLMPYAFGAGEPYWGYGHGLGVHVLMDHGQAGIPDANGSYWKDGGTGTLFWVDPQHELTGVVLYQHNPFHIYPIWTQMRALAYQALEDA
ncbi:MAG: serine hydrolase domain-containing protein [Anaerolineae bacterium]